MPGPAQDDSAATPARADPCKAARESMVRTLRGHGIRDERVIAAMAAIPRHAYIPGAHLHGDAYGDHPCPIGYGQTISQPYIVAYMTELLQVSSGQRVLDVGTGSGYQAAVLAALGAQVFGLEVVPELTQHARRALAAQGVTAVQVRLGDGYVGWEDEAPFDRITVGCAPEEIPRVLVEQLAEGGRLVLPVGQWGQRLMVIERSERGVCKRNDLAVRFVPMVHPGGRSGGHAP